MDLIASYMSDHSDVESEAHTRKRVKKNVITLDYKHKSTKIVEVLLPAKLTDRCKTLENSAEYVTLSDSDSEHEIQSAGKNLSIKKTTLSTTPKVKIDYLNLDSSDSDDEKQNGVSGLLKSAALLNDVECGPAKPNRHQRKRIIHNDSSAASDDLMVVYSNLQKKDFKQIISGDKHCSSESVPDVIDGSSEDEVVCVSDSDIYREDTRVSRAFEGPCICYIPTKLSRTYAAHKSMVTALSWCMIKYSHLLLSASADCTLKIWDIFLKREIPVQCIQNSSAFKAAKWSHDGKKIFAGGFGQKVHVYEASTGKEICSYDVNKYVSSIEAHPFDDNLILCGTQNAIQSFDLRENSLSPARTFLSNCEEVLDIAFLNEDSFVCTTNVVSRDSADRTIMVWDLRSAAILSNQIFLERYTCPSIKVNYHDNSFAAQTNGDYVATFSMERPYKIQNKRYVGHKVSGFGIECDISPNGKYLVSGSANGDVYFYDYKSSSIMHKLITQQDIAINRVNWHPLFASIVATGSWDGQLQIWK